MRWRYRLHSSSTETGRAKRSRTLREEALTMREAGTVESDQPANRLMAQAVLVAFEISARDNRPETRPRNRNGGR